MLSFCLFCDKHVLWMLIKAIDRTSHQKWLKCSVCRLPPRQAFWMFATKPKKPRAVPFSSTTNMPAYMVMVLITRLSITMHFCQKRPILMAAHACRLLEWLWMILRKTFWYKALVRVVAQRTEKWLKWLWVLVQQPLLTASADALLLLWDKLINYCLQELTLPRSKKSTVNQRRLPVV